MPVFNVLNGNGRWATMAWAFLVLWMAGLTTFGVKHLMMGGHDAMERRMTRVEMMQDSMETRMDDVEKGLLRNMIEHRKATER